MMFWIVASALFLDRWIGDPKSLPHPVVWIGRYILWFENRWNGTEGVSKRRSIWYGICLTASTLAISSGLTWIFLYLLHLISPILAHLVSILLIATTIAWKGLLDAGKDVANALYKEGLESARRAVAMIVGRDTYHLNESEIVRATVETLAENIVDGLVSPIFFACIGGAPLAMFYRAANTLDSMVGYKNEKYIYFGWASARLDDVLNYLPARLTALLLVPVFFLCKLDVLAGWRVMRQDARRHPSPNSGIPESMVAGALGVQLGGTNYYKGVRSERATMGDAKRALVAMDIRYAQTMVEKIGWIILILLVAGGLCWCGSFGHLY